MRSACSARVFPGAARPGRPWVLAGCSSSFYRRGNGGPGEQKSDLAKVT